MCANENVKVKQTDGELQAKSCRGHPGARTSPTTTTASKTASCWTEVAAGSGMTSAAISTTFTGSARAVSTTRVAASAGKNPVSELKGEGKKGEGGARASSARALSRLWGIRSGWNPPASFPHCLPNRFAGPPTCGSPEKSENTTIVGSKRTIGSTIEYVCPDGYMLVGSKSRICAASGFWNGDVPTCKCEYDHNDAPKKSTSALAVLLIVSDAAAVAFTARYSFTGKLFQFLTRIPTGEPGVALASNIAISHRGSISYQDHLELCILLLPTNVTISGSACNIASTSFSRDAGKAASIPVQSHAHPETPPHPREKLSVSGSVTAPERGSFAFRCSSSNLFSQLSIAVPCRIWRTASSACWRAGPRTVLSRTMPAMRTTRWWATRSGDAETAVSGAATSPDAFVSGASNLHSREPFHSEAFRVMQVLERGRERESL